MKSTLPPSGGFDKTLLKDIIIQLYDSKVTNNITCYELPKLLYLIDWVYAVNFDKLLTNLNWYYDHNGVMSNKLITYLKNVDGTFIGKEGNRSIYEYSDQDYYELIDHDYTPLLDSETVKVINHVVKKTKDLNRIPDFIKYVLSTYPLMITNKYDFIDLLECAKYHKQNLEQDK